MSPSDEDLEALRRLAAERGGVSGTTGSRAEQLGDNPQPLEDIDALLAGPRTVREPRRGTTPTAPPQVTSTEESLQDLVQMGRVGHTSVRASSPAPAEPLETLDQLLQQAPSPGRVDPVAASPRAYAHPTTTAESIDNLAHQGRVVPTRPPAGQQATTNPARRQPAARPAPPSSAPDPVAKPVRPLVMKDAEVITPQAGLAPSSALPGYRRPRSLALAAMLLVSVLVALYRHLPVGPSYPTPLAAQVVQLAEAIDAYREQHQDLPSNLSLLQNFPKDAVEWPMENYGLRILERRPEFFFDRSSADYLIIGRHGEEAWVYAKDLDPPLQQVPAH